MYEEDKQIDIEKPSGIDFALILVYYIYWYTYTYVLTIAAKICQIEKYWYYYTYIQINKNIYK